jgi:hypothetical protein
MTNETAILEDVLSASSLMDLDGALGKKPNRVYLMYARKVHPDMFQEDAHKVLAQKAFAHLADLKDLSEGKAAPSVAAKAKANDKRIRTKKHTYDLKVIFHKNDTFTKYTTTYDDGHKEALLAILNDPQDMDLAENHVEAVKKLNEEIPDQYKLFYPAFIENFKFRDEQTGVERLIVATEEDPGFRTMADIFEVYPKGIGGRDVAWIFRRMLVAVGNAHDIGLVNGAPNVDAFMVHDEKHGIVLTDWQYSVPLGTPLKAVPSAYKDIYPKYALEKEPVDDRLDIHIIATMAERLLADTEPRQLFAFFKGCKLANVPRAAVLLAEFDKLIDRLYGERKFNQFTLRKGE